MCACNPQLVVSRDLVESQQRCQVWRELCDLCGPQCGADRTIDISEVVLSNCSLTSQEMDLLRQLIRSGRTPWRSLILNGVHSFSSLATTTEDLCVRMYNSVHVCVCSGVSHFFRFCVRALFVRFILPVIGRCLRDAGVCCEVSADEHVEPLSRLVEGADLSQLEHLEISKTCVCSLCSVQQTLKTSFLPSACPLPSGDFFFDGHGVSHCVVALVNPQIRTSLAAWNPCG